MTDQFKLSLQVSSVKCLSERVRPLSTQWVWQNYDMSIARKRCDVKLNELRDDNKLMMNDRDVKDYTD